MTDGVAIRDAASIIVLRDTPAGPQVLMGQRGASAAFMPDKFVFPGGAVDASDAQVPLTLPDPCASRLQSEAGIAPQAIAAAALRELWEETGLAAGNPGAWPDPPAGWAGFAERGLRPSGEGLRFIFRAVTPPGRTRRFDARFFLLPAARIHGDPDDFSQACDELRDLQWIPLNRARSLDLPFITEVVLAEVSEVLRLGLVQSVPFFDNSGTRSEFRRIA